ncbi:ATP-dependent DNA helicase RecQ [Pullulanibacillus pueri]|uniref:ATP-dependent DNA helicase RecQ n=1 Tax=Pullulanibacillus pueri TaxID=1437324 RepID=A0A8J2ZV67_9BACL|nr:ATP-dependent DNA helicase RecQ [Pullulanibacillus pueri]MBM7681500.1 ATP-dependent DNA helicase RecQ [Pullulanibacillus pueri]GGH79128.1 ATP-dependent DNA helicase RecQ [Pullulanibacillus pueri]
MLTALLNERFGYTSFRPGQKEVIEDVIKGHDVFAMLPTGSGKSICYLLAGYCREGLVVIVSPLLSLMDDQVQNIRMHGETRVAALNSFLSKEEWYEVLDHLEQIKFLLLSPEMLQSHIVQQKLRNRGVGLFTVDEAHCVSQWGYEFRPDYLKLKNIRQYLGHPPCLALTATADPQVRADIIEKLGMEKGVQHVYSVDRPNISLCVEEFQGTLQKQERMVELALKLKGPGIIYFSSREWTETATTLLQEQTPLRVAFYHGGMSGNERRLIQMQFLNDELDIVCCTNAFGMGINKPNVRYVIHFHYPKHLNAYLQEIGRAGRDGLPSIALLLYTPEDHAFPMFFIEKEFPTEAQLSAVIDEYTFKRERDVVQLAIEKGCSESAARFLKEQLQTFGDNEEKKTIMQKLQELITERKRIKLNEHKKFLQWLQASGCRREGLLRLFGEYLNHEVHECCDHCQVHLQPYFTGSVTTTQRNESQANASWLSRLEMLLSEKVGRGVNAEKS